jgi:hypothetical protein
MRMIDPPSGWKYGFPKPFDPKPGQGMLEWLAANGYPQQEIDSWQGKVPCSIWGADESDPTRTPEEEILARVQEWAGGRAEAERWYQSQPIPALGGRTAQQVVKEGGRAAIESYLDHLSTGGFA